MKISHFRFQLFEFTTGATILHLKSMVIVSVCWVWRAYCMEFCFWKRRKSDEHHHQQTLCLCRSRSLICSLKSQICILKNFLPARALNLPCTRRLATGAEALAEHSKNLKAEGFPFRFSSLRLGFPRSASDAAISCCSVAWASWLVKSFEVDP